MTYLKHVRGLLIVILGLTFLISLLPLGTALEFTGDEGYEVMKPFLCTKGHVLYKEIWSDQPPVFTMLLASAFKAFSPSILVARLVVAGFAVLLVAAFYEMIRERSGEWCALLATFFLIAAPGVIVLSVSVMQEVPAMALGLFSAWLMFQWGRRRHWAWLIGSGVAMGLAIQLKLTAVLIVPAVMVEFILMSWTKRTQTWRREAILNMLLWGASLVVVLTAIGLTWGKGSLEVSWKAHTGEQVVPALERVADHKFEPKLLLSHLECLLAAVVCVVLAKRRKRLREIAFPLALLITDSLIHSVHRPWWNYYYLHLAVPLCWLAGWAINEMVRSILQLQAKQRFNLGSAKTWKQLALCALVALAVAHSERRLEGAVKELRQKPKTDENPIVMKMKEYASRTHLVYTPLPMYAFQARLPLAPQFAVISSKRFWSGQITTPEIVAACERDKPELIILPIKIIGEEWQGLLDKNYAILTNDKFCTLYTTKSVQPSSALYSTHRKNLISYWAVH